MTAHSSKMSDHLSQTQLAAYNGRTLYPDELLSADNHLASCDECHERLTRMAPAVGRLSPVFHSGEEPFHLDYEQHLEPYVDGRANEIEREIVDSHVALCSQCAADLKDLLAFKQQPIVATTDDAPTRSPRKPWLPPLSFLPAPAWAMAAVISLFALIAAAVLWTTYQSSRRVEQAETPPPANDQPTQGFGRPQPSPAPTGHTAQTNPTTNPSPQNTESVPEPSKDHALIVVYDGHGELVLTQRGRLEGLEELPPDLRESIERALVTRRLPASPALTGWYAGASNVRGGPDAQADFAPVAPTNVVVESDRPEFRWRALDAAQDYTVTVYDSNSRQVATSGPVTGTAWTTPTPLARGDTYSWQISALKDGQNVISPKPPLPEARFKVLDQPAVTMLARLRETVGNSHLAMGVFYWKHGLIPESEREFQALAKANPKSDVVKALLANIRTIRDG